MRDNSSRFAVPEEQPQHQAKAVDLMSFAAPTQFVDLPSKGEHYPEGHPLHGKDSVEIKFMTAKEEDILASQELIKKGVVLDRLIQSLIIDKRIKPDDMLLGDKTAIMYAARISAYGPEYNTKFFCRHCTEAVQQVFNLEDIAIREPDLNDVVFENGHYVCVLPVTGVRVALRLLTGRDEKEMTDFVRNQNAETGALITQLMFMIHSINDIDAKAQIYNFIQNMPMRDSKYLREVHSKISPTMDTTMKITCNNCSTEQEVDLPMSVEFFWPKQ